MNADSAETPPEPNLAPMPTFEVRPYVPDGGYTPAGSALVLGTAIGTGLVAGLIASFIGQFFWLVLVFPAAVGLAVGGVGMKAVQAGKVRSPGIAGLAGLLGGCFASLIAHYMDYGRFQDMVAEIDPEIRKLAEMPKEQRARDPRIVADPRLGKIIEEDGLAAAVGVRNFFDYLDYAATQGVTLSRTGGGGSGINLGYVGTCVYWGVEWLIVGVIGFAMMQMAASEPFCTACLSWKKTEYLGSLNVAGEHAVSVVESGDLGRWRTARPAIERGESEVSAAVCPHCDAQSDVDVKLEQVTRVKNKPEQRKLLKQITYPGEAIVWLRQQFQASVQSASTSTADSVAVNEGEPVGRE